MEAISRILFILLTVVAFFFIVITVVFGSKSDAMSGGSSQIRTTYAGKPGFDDFVSRWTLILGAILMALSLGINVIQAHSKPTSVVPASKQAPPPETPR